MENIDPEERLIDFLNRKKDWETPQKKQNTRFLGICKEVLDVSSDVTVGYVLDHLPKKERFRRMMRRSSGSIKQVEKYFNQFGRSLKNS